MEEGRGCAQGELAAGGSTLTVGGGAPARGAALSSTGRRAQAVSSMHLSLIVWGTAARQGKQNTCRCQGTCWELSSVAQSAWHQLCGEALWPAMAGTQQGQAFGCMQMPGGCAACSQSQGVSGRAGPCRMPHADWGGAFAICAAGWATSCEQCLGAWHSKVTAATGTR